MSTDLQPSAGTAESAQANPSAAGELDLFALLLLLRAHLKTILSTALLCTGLMVAFVLLAKPRYAATASILVPQKSSPADSLARALSGGLDLLGGGFEIYVDILRSHAVVDALIQKHDLVQHYHAEDREAAERALAGATTMTALKEGMLTVTVEDTDKQLAAALANDYFAELDRLNRGMSMSSAGQERKYYERQVELEKNALADAEVALKNVQERQTPFVPEAAAQAALNEIEQTRAQIRIRQVQLQALEQGETASNPEVIRLKAEISGLEGQLAAMQRGGGGGAATSASGLPSQSLNYVRALREVKYHETIFESLSKQLEIAHQNEAKDLSQVEVLDPGRVALHKNWPPRTLYTLAAFVGGLVLGVLLVVLRAFASTVLRNPENRRRLASFKQGIRETPLAH